jgi:hypothetical protein
MLQDFRVDPRVNPIFCKAVPLGSVKALFAFTIEGWTCKPTGHHPALDGEIRK